MAWKKKAAKIHELFISIYLHFKAISKQEKIFEWNLPCLASILEMPYEYKVRLTNAAFIMCEALI